MMGNALPSGDMSAEDTIPESTLAEMVDYYRARAAEYDEWFYRRGRYDRGPEANALWHAEVEEVRAALDGFGIEGDVLELAGGTGIWTEHLLRTARSVTVVDASPEMLAINRARIHSDRVRYIQADLFGWRPDRSYHGVFFAFWLSHVPTERLDSFLQMVAGALRSGGKIFLVDSRREPTSTARDHKLPESDTQMLTRRLNDGREFRIVKNFLQPDELVDRAARAGLELVVHETGTYFLYGMGSPRTGA
jgi:SAM-dependent methyltransferase